MSKDLKHFFKRPLAICIASCVKGLLKLFAQFSLGCWSFLLLRGMCSLPGSDTHPLSDLRFTDISSHRLLVYSFV